MSSWWSLADTSSLGVGSAKEESNGDIHHCYHCSEPRHSSLAKVRPRSARLRAENEGVQPFHIVFVPQQCVTIVVTRLRTLGYW